MGALDWIAFTDSSVRLELKQAAGIDAGLTDHQDQQKVDLCDAHCVCPEVQHRSHACQRTSQLAPPPTPHTARSMADVSEHVTCSVCLSPFNVDARRPIDLGCGHSVCEECIQTNPRAFRCVCVCVWRAGLHHGARAQRSLTVASR
jgi:hypothetical protein